MGQEVKNEKLQEKRTPTTAAAAPEQKLVIAPTGPKNGPKGPTKKLGHGGWLDFYNNKKYLIVFFNLSTQDLQRLLFNRKKCFCRQWTLLKCSMDQIMFCFADGCISYLRTLCPKKLTIILKNSVSTNKLVTFLWVSLIEDGFSICMYSKLPIQDSWRFSFCVGLFEIFNSNSFEELCFYIYRALSI